MVCNIALTAEGRAFTTTPRCIRSATAKPTSWSLWEYSETKRISSPSVNVCCCRFMILSSVMFLTITYTAKCGLSVGNNPENALGKSLSGKLNDLAGCARCNMRKIQSHQIKQRKVALTLPLPHRTQKLIVTAQVYRMSTNPNHTAPIIINTKIIMTALESDSELSMITLRCACHGSFPGCNGSRHKVPIRK